MKTIIITGCSGFVARHFMNYLDNQERNFLIVGLDINKPLYEVQLKNNSFEFVKIDLLNTSLVKELLQKYRPDFLLHLAAFSSVAYSWQYPVESFNNNVNICLNIINAVREINLSTRILSIGSSEIYGRKTIDDMPLCETSELNPVSPYAVARASQEMLSKLFYDEYGVNIVLTRSFNHTGPFQEAKFVIPGFVEKILNAKKNNANVITCGNIDVIRDFSDVRDVVRAYYMLLMNGKCGETYNVCSGTGHSLREIIEMICNIAEYKVEPKIDQSLIRPDDPAIIIGSNYKIQSTLGWKPVFDINLTLKSMMER